MKSRYLLAIPILASSLGANAEVTLDGTLGRSGALPGPDYLIGADLGRQHGGNLFHSFKYFNLNRFESATFSGPNNINNVISRVTGGNPSNIDGLIRSTIPADMYFLNPNGLMFGPNARLDVQGSFHASTADYLRLGNGGRFDARNHRSSLLTVAPVEAFGFLTGSPAEIVTQDSNLSVPDYQTLSLIGGDLSLKGHLVFDESGKQQFNFVDYPLIPLSIPIYSNQLLAKSGRINLVSVATKGEVKLTESGVSTNMRGGKIVVNKTDINVNGEGGDIFIRGGQFELRSSHIENQNLGAQAGGLIDIDVDSFIMQGGKNYAGIQTESRDVGQGGTIKIHAKQITASNGTFISASNYHLGDTGVISIQADTLSISGKFIPEMGIPSGIFSVVISINPLMEKFNAGAISIEANQIKLMNGAEIGAITFGPKDAANINVKVHDSLVISGSVMKQALGVNNFFFPSSFISSSFSGSQLLKDLGINYSNNGDGGSIKIEAGHINIKNGGGIISETFRADGGDIKIRAEQLTLTDLEDIAFIDTLGNTSSITTVARGSGSSGNIQIYLSGDFTIFKHIDLNLLPDILKDYNLLHGIRTFSIKSNARKTGDILIHADNIKLNGHGIITTESKSGSGGNITIYTPNLLYLQEGEITTSVHGGTGDGGNITIFNPQFQVLNQGKIKAQADEGHGGNIRIVAAHFIKSTDSLISASSKLGVDGEVVVNSPDSDISGKLFILSTKMVNAADQLQKPCNSRIAENLSSFTIIPSEGTPNQPDDLLPSGPILFKLKPAKTTKSSNGKSTTRHLQIAYQRGCKPAPATTKSGAKSSIIPEQLF